MKHVWGAGAKPALVRRGRRLAELRREAGLSQQELADVVGLTQATISRIEAGINGMTEGVKIRLADALGRDPADVWPFLTPEEADLR